MYHIDAETDISVPRLQLVGGGRIHIIRCIHGNDYSAMLTYLVHMNDGRLQDLFLTNRMCV